MADDFIDDDDGSGYVDDGRDDWDQHHDHSDMDNESEDEEEYYNRTGQKKKKSKAKKASTKGQADAKGSLSSAFARRAGRPPANHSSAHPRPANRNMMEAYRPSVAMEKEDDFMNRLMSGLGSTVEPAGSRTSETLHSRKRKQNLYQNDVFTSLQRSPDSPPSSDPLDPPSDGIHPNVHIAGSDSPDWSPNHVTEEDEHTKKRLRSTSKHIGNLGLNDERDGIEEAALHRRIRSQSRIDSALLEDLASHSFSDDEDELDFSIQASKPSTTHTIRNPPVNVTSVRTKQDPLQSTHEVRVKEEVDTTLSPSKDDLSTSNKHWSSIGAKLANVTEAVSAEARSSSDNSTRSKVKPFEADGRHVRFFWTDYTEQQGIIYLIGKVKDQSSNRFVSACLQVEGVERCVYLQPREDMTEDDVYEEFDSMREKFGIKSFLAKYVTRKYAFELPSVPAESQYLKVKYGFDEPQLPLDLSGKTFSRAFGINTSAFELFVVKRGIMGPCWLNVENADLRETGTLSWCKVELSVDDAKFVKPFADTDQNAPRDTPPLTIMSISVRTIVNHQENKKEVVAVATRTWKDISLEDPTPPEELQSSLFSVVRPLVDMFPPRFEQEAKSSGTKVMTVKYERMLLNTLLAQIQQQDPDVIVGHEFSGVSLDVLLHRMRDLKADHWSRIGRLRRPKWPSLRQGFNVRLTAGRLICDLASDMAKGMITSTTWSLTEMCASHLKVHREDIDPDDTASFFDPLAPTPERLLKFVRQNEVDAYFQMALASKVQLLALTKQLTNLAGNSWSRTLNGGRAERNEYILLHEFHRQKYICPDKLSKSEREHLAKQQQIHEEEHDGEGDKTSGNKKDKYKGGLVFDPKRGLWDKYILVMDFNSLYPSLIQEFNIDFTTVDRKECNEHPEDVERMPDVPSSDIGQGVLPRLISTLVARRRQVKSLMKDRNAGTAKQLQWNIKQQALKLTANSMYGCLGFEGSRFYARPLAALTTFKGRETLTATKELAESLGLDVIYGDTDSVMINTNVLDLNEARRIGNEFKKAVNERYRLLEIDIDGIFERMLLLQKKKYAAIKIDDDSSRTTEIKGLDMKRREYCALSKNVSEYVLGQILSGEPTDTVVEKIHEYLENISQRLDDLPLDDFIIYKALSKKLNEYNEQSAKSLPHVQVAKRMQAKGLTVRTGEVIPYVFCLGDDEWTSTKTAQAERAFHPDDLRRKDTSLRIDKQYYLSLQLLPPIERLCDSIVGTDRSRLAEHLGLDPSKYQSISLSSSPDDRNFTTLDSQTPDAVRFAECEKLQIKCPACQSLVPFQGLSALTNSNGNNDDSKELLTVSRAITSNGLACSNCDTSWGIPFVAMQLEAMIRKHIDRYYQAWVTCTDVSCGTKTRLQAINARRCLVPGCKGKVVVQYGDKALYDQLCYLESLFDGDRCLDRLQTALAASADVPSAASRQIELLQSRWLVGSRSRLALETLRGIVGKYTARSGRRYVGLDKLFGWMRVDN